MSVRRAAEQVIMDAEERFEGFENLMPFKVHNILLVSSLYDSFILREDGRLNELLIDQSLDLSPEHVPGITHVSSCAEAAELARSQQFNLIVTNLTVGDMNAAQLASEVKQAGLEVPVVVLAYDYREIKKFVARNPVTEIERIFLWQGNARILIADSHPRLDRFLQRRQPHRPRLFFRRRHSSHHDSAHHLLAHPRGHDRGSALAA